MRVVLQRVTSAEVNSEGVLLGKIGHGLLAFVAIAPNDTMVQGRWLIEKICAMRLFDCGSGFMEQSLQQVEGEVLLVSQFTLYADVRKGTRPSFSKAMAPVAASELFAQFVVEFSQRLPGRVQCGRFGADMQVSLVNDGPVTLIIDSDAQ